MKKRISHKLVSILLVAALAVLSLAGCASSETDSDGDEESATETVSEENVTLRIAAQPYPLYSSIWVAYELGYLDEELSAVGVEYTWTEFQSGPLVNEAVAAGEADLGYMADLPAIIAKSSGQEIEIVSNVAYGEKGLAVLVTPDSDITSVADLEGKKIAYATGSYAQHLLALLLDQEGLSLDDVESINLGAGDQPAALTSGEVDAIVIWEQYISKMTTEGTAVVLADGTGIKRGNMVTYAVADYAEEHPEAIEAYIRALDRAGEYIESNPTEAAEAIADDFGIDAELMETIFGSFTFTTDLTQEDIDEITAVKDFSLEAGIISNDVDIDAFINTDYLDAVE
ncbi:MAG: aliphatic sulfonate ABC transporter substrate-binding protein [Clostridiales bacterium]|nr:aliphatic sulfonate ABC transporter substrate-binding protein [Clostridiales bacterium]